MSLDEESLRPITEKVIGAAIEVHRHLGPGLLESAYQTCLAHELSLRGISFRTQVDIPIRYKGISLGSVYRLDFLVEHVLILELKTVSKLEEIHRAQLLTYLKATKLPLGLLINFNSPRLIDGLDRMVNGLKTRTPSNELGDVDLQL